MKRRAFTLIEVMATLTIATLMIGAAMVFFNLMLTRMMRVSVVQREETAHDLAMREMSESIKRAREVAIHSTPGSTDSVALGNELAVKAEDGSVMSFRFIPPEAIMIENDTSADEERSLRSIYRAGRLIAYSDAIGERVLLNFCSVPSGNLFDMQLGLPRARWEMHMARFRSRVQQAPHTKFVVIAAPLRMR